MRVFSSLTAREVAKLPSAVTACDENVSVTRLVFPLLHQNEWTIWNVIGGIIILPVSIILIGMLGPSHFGCFSPGRLKSGIRAAWYMHGWYNKSWPSKRRMIALPSRTVIFLVCHSVHHRSLEILENYDQIYNVTHPSTVYFITGASFTNRDYFHQFCDNSMKSGVYLLFCARTSTAV